MAVATAEAGKPAAPPMRYPDGFWVVKDGTKLHYVHAGSGVPVILIHGARGSAVGSWFSNGIAPEIAKTNHVYALEMRGHGLSGGSNNGHGNMADDVIEFMDQMGIKKAHIGGYSMGGAITLQVLMKAPERFITACFQGAGAPETKEWRAKIPADVEGKDPDEDRANAIAAERRAAKGEQVGNDFGHRMREGKGPWFGGATGRRARAAMMEMQKRQESQFADLDLKAIDFPVMSINGEFDRPNMRTHRFWRELRNFTNLVLPGKGHLTAMMAGFIPDAYVYGYAAFIAANNPRG